MRNSYYWRTGAKLAWRNLRNSPIRVALISVAMAVSIASVGGVRGVAEITRKALQGDPRAWLAADLCADTREPILREQVDALNRMKLEGSDWTVMTITLTMAASDQSADPAFITVKAVDPMVYPYYGALRLSVKGSFSEILQPESVAVSRDVLERLEVQVGDQIRIAGHPFRIAALIKDEPDRFSGESGIGLRCILSRAAYDRTGLEATSGTLAKQRVLVRLAPGSDLGTARWLLQKIFPEGAVRDSRRVHQRQSAITENVISFLSVTSFLALALGGIGVSIAIRQHANAELPRLAIMRMLGATSMQMAVIFFVEAAWIMMAALVIGVPLGALVREFIVSLASSYMTLPEVTGWRLSSLLANSSIALLAMAPALVGPALMIRNFRPSIVLRDSAAEISFTPAAWKQRLFIGTFAGLVFAALAYWTLRSWSSALLLTATLGLTAVMAKLMTMATLRYLHWAGRLENSKGTLFRHGVTSLSRPGNYSQMLIVALATVLTMMITTFVASNVATRSAFEILPFDRDSLYLAGFHESNNAAVREFLEHLPGVENVVVMSQLRLELWAVLRSAPVHARQAATASFQRQNSLNSWNIPRRTLLADRTCEPGYTLDTFKGSDVCQFTAQIERIPYSPNPSGPDVRSQLLAITTGSNALSANQWNVAYARLASSPQSGNFFPAANRNQTMTIDYYLEQRANFGWDGRSYNVVCTSTRAPAQPGPVRVIVDENEARHIGARLGSRLEFASRDRFIEGNVAEIRRFKPSDRYWSLFQLDCSGLDPSALLRLAALRVGPDAENRVRNAIRDEYPSLAVITPEDVAETLSEISNDAMRLVRVVAWYAIGSGLCVLIAVVAASRAARLREIGIFSALGARRFTMIRIYTVEFATLGLVSALIAGALAWGFGSVALSVVFQSPQIMNDWHAIAASIGIAIPAVVFAGWLPTYPLLRRKPMEVLRREPAESAAGF
jgi:predicted lysophospholipase L1 biosynthesis ABC-type transport system permease subunit